jgi:tRNA(Ile2) C34 agmatinyltransferase TiaS
VEGHAVLFEISKDEKEISLYFFEGMKIHAQDIFNRWLEGDEISLLTESEKLSFVLNKENAPKE